MKDFHLLIVEDDESMINNYELSIKTYNKYREKEDIQIKPCIKKNLEDGLKALKELGIISPLKEARLNKENIRLLSKNIYDLPTFNLPSMACLSTRIPYGEEITKIKLHKIEKVEKHLASLGFSNFRARYHGNLLRIEIPKNELNKIITDKISKSIIELSKNIGFTYITIDLEGYKKGSLNEFLR